jgi:formate hydrogenlyase regulatory protein HycA
VAAPDKLLIHYEDDEYARFNLVGRYGDDNHYMAFVTGAFPADWCSGRCPPEYLKTRWEEHKRWYAVLHRFDPDGNRLGTDVRPGGTTADGEQEAIDRADDELQAMLRSLDRVRPCDILVRPFGVEIEGYSSDWSTSAWTPRILTTRLLRTSTSCWSRTTSRFIPRGIAGSIRRERLLQVHIGAS